MNYTKARVWWIPQVPGTPFYAEVPTVAEAKRLAHTLALYDQFQYDHNIKPDYSNAGGVQVLRNGEWEDEDED